MFSESSRIESNLSNLPESLPTKDLKASALLSDTTVMACDGHWAAKSCQHCDESRFEDRSSLVRFAAAFAEVHDHLCLVTAKEAARSKTSAHGITCQMQTPAKGCVCPALLCMRLQ